MRTTEPLVNTDNAKAVLKSSLLSAVVFLSLTIFFSFLSISGEEDDGALRGALSLIFGIPIFWLVLFIYFFILGAFKPVKLKFAVITQLILTTVIVFFPVLLFSSGKLILDIFIPSLYGVIFLNIVLLPGTWLLVKSTHNKQINKD